MRRLFFERSFTCQLCQFLHRECRGSGINLQRSQGRIALGILAELFPDRPVVGIHAVDLVWGPGTLHCLTQQEPQP
jgi:hypothetical protein